MKTKTIYAAIEVPEDFERECENYYFRHGDTGDDCEFRLIDAPPAAQSGEADAWLITDGAGDKYACTDKSLADAMRTSGNGVLRVDALYKHSEPAPCDSAQPECATCNDEGAVGNILNAEPCPDCSQPTTNLVDVSSSRDGWLPIETAPEDKLVVVAWHMEDGWRYDFDWIEEGAWYVHHDNFEHYSIAGKPEGISCIGPNESAPYTHWKHLGEPALRSQHEKESK